MLAELCLLSCRAPRSSWKAKRRRWRESFASSTPLLSLRKCRYFWAPRGRGAAERNGQRGVGQLDVDVQAAARVSGLTTFQAPHFRWIVEGTTPLLWRGGRESRESNRSRETIRTMAMNQCIN